MVLNYAYDAPTSGLAVTTAGYLHYQRLLGDTAWTAIDPTALMVGRAALAGPMPAGFLTRGKTYEYRVVPTNSSGSGPESIVQISTPMMTLTSPTITSDPLAGTAVTWTNGTAVSTTGGATPTLTHKLFVNGTEVLNATSGSYTSTVEGDVIAVAMDATDSSGTAREVDGRTIYAVGTTVVTETSFEGRVRKRALPATSRFTAGTRWLNLAAQTVANVAASVYTGAIGMVGVPQMDTGNKLLIKSAPGTSLGFDMTWSGLTVAPPTDKMLSVVLYFPNWPDIPNRVLNSMGFVVRGATGATRYICSSAYINFDGTCTVTLIDANDADAMAALNNANYTVTSTTGSNGVNAHYNWTENISDFRIYTNIQNIPDAQVLLLGVFSSSRLKKPLMLSTTDTSDESAVNLMVPAAKARGIKPAIRSGGADIFRNTDYLAAFKKVVGDGSAEVYNGAYQRWPNGTISAKQTELDYKQQSDWMRTNGLGDPATNPGIRGYSGAGNALGDRAKRQRAAWMSGLTIMKGGAKNGIYFGPHGIDDPTSLFTFGSGSLSAMQRYTNMAEKFGSIAISFSHNYATYGSTPVPDANNGVATGGEWIENTISRFDWLNTNSSNGTLNGKIKAGTFKEINDFLLGN
ncbi:hypothetical protein GT347_16030 [Xylophilus rhododendri]|uniref:Uncharacterized protein n=1 Tax=Xylophilus rhododendri TaxID=2697032 RepID=A0A857J812_9BURK|nr:hypothetical protein [Xylophilus rhododendri]QHI99353.1 hypothetical protein GT347_16030 [Xylophilus rhododendri]